VSRLGGFSAADVGSSRPVVAIPIGSCEQHGPHLPLGTDTLIATALADRLASRRAMVPVVVGPALAVSASGEHAGFPGTLSIGTEVTAAVLIELARSAGWAAGIVLVNGHGGNAEAVDRAVAVIRDEGRNVLAWWPHVPDGDAHAGRTETSLMLAIDPRSVALARAEAGDRRPLATIAAELRRGGVRAVSPNGVLGDPTGATLEEGRTLLDELTNDLVAAVDDARNTW
jgi:creatinine amidohydrolase